MWGAVGGGDDSSTGSGHPGWAAQGGAAAVVVVAVHVALRPLAAVAAAARSLPGQSLPSFLRRKQPLHALVRGGGGAVAEGPHAAAGAAGRVAAAVVPAAAGAPSTAAVLACFALVVALQALLGTMADLLPRLAQVHRPKICSTYALEWTGDH